MLLFLNWDGSSDVSCEIFGRYQTDLRSNDVVRNRCWANYSVKNLNFLEYFWHIIEIVCTILSLSSFKFYSKILSARHCVLNENKKMFSKSLSFCAIIHNFPLKTAGWRVDSMVPFWQCLRNDEFYFKFYFKIKLLYFLHVSKTVYLQLISATISHLY